MRGDVEPSERIAVELELPVGEPRERLLDALARLIRLRGFETFVGAPLLLPQPRFFPERWERSLRGAGRLLTRLLRYASLDALAVRLRGFRRRASEVGERVWIRQYGDTAAAWYAGTHDGVCHFGLELRGLDNEELLVAALAHEVAHAFREKHDLCARDRDAEEKLTDLTAVYLGFGLFLANASLLVESGGYSEGGQKLLYERHSLGYLSPAEFALLLSAQVVTRGRPDERRALHAALRPNHAQLFERGCEEFSLDPMALRARLGVPEPEVWPPPPAIDELLAKPVTDDDIECIEPQDDAGPSESGRPVVSGQVAFRVRQHASALFALGGFVAAVVLGAVLEPPGIFWVVLLTVGTYAGYRWGALRHADECSDCRARLAPGAERCDGCQANIVGEISNRAERLDALERYQASRPRPQQSTTRAELDDPLAELLTAMFLAWGYCRGLASDRANEGARALEQRCLAGDFDTRALARTWVAGGALNQEGTSFGRYYIRSAPARVRARDLQIVRTAASFGDDPQSYRRFATVLDRRFEEWRTAAGERPVHAL
jgi:hypothetical protein